MTHESPAAAPQTDMDADAAADTDADVVVVGGGAMGSAAAWRAAERGHSVLLLEQFEQGHAKGASHGATRNFSLTYAADDYVGLVQRAGLLWDELAATTGRQVLDLVGIVNHGGPAGLLRTFQEVGAERGVASTLLSAADAEQRFVGLHFESDVLHVPGSGRIHADIALLALREAAERLGARFHYSSPVRRILVDGPDRARVLTDDAEITAKRVVVTAGGWTEKLLGGLVRLPRLVVTEEQPVHFAPLDDTLEWPGFNHRPDTEARASATGTPGGGRDAWFLGPVYGMRTPGEGIKVGWHGSGPVVDPDVRSDEPDPAQLLALQRYAREWLPGVDPDSFVPISCTYTSTDSEDFLLERTGPIVVGAGFSGHGFKFTPQIGEFLVDLVEGGTVPERFRGR